MRRCSVRLKGALLFMIGYLFFTTSGEVCNGGDECCAYISCGLGEGDCDSDEDCNGSLVCGEDNCIGDSFDSTDDCCVAGITATTTTTTTTTATTITSGSAGQETCSRDTVDKAITLLGIETAGNRADRRRALIEELAKTSSYNDVELDNWPLVDMRTLVGFASISHVLLSQNTKTRSELKQMNYEDQRKAIIEAVNNSTQGSTQDLQSLGDFALTMEASTLLGQGASSGINDTLITLRNSGLENAKKSCNGRDDCCTAEEPCERGEGDCDEDNDHEQCHGNLKCGKDNCKKGAPFDLTDDCCEGEDFHDASARIVTECMCGEKGPSIESPDRKHNEDAWNRIIGGNATAEDEFPWQVEITVSGQFYGGGTLITPSHVLTANHVVRKQKARDVRARLGSNDATKNKAFRVKEIFNHPDYTNTPHTAFDFAILQLEIPVPFGNSMKPACLPGPSIPDLAERGVIVTGWGTTTSDPSKRKYQKFLVKTPFPDPNDLEIISNIECQKVFRKKGSVLRVEENMLCTAPNNVVDSCTGDSGGPMVVFDIDLKRWTLVGVVSFGFRCASDYPAVYGRVTTVMEWIKKKVNLKGSNNEMYDNKCDKLN